MSKVWIQMADEMRARCGVDSAEDPIAPKGVRTE
jgi:hypothetical protein